MNSFLTGTHTPTVTHTPTLTCTNTNLCIGKGLEPRMSLVQGLPQCAITEASAVTGQVLLQLHLPYCINVWLKF